MAPCITILPSPTLDPHRPDCQLRPLPPPPQPRSDWAGLHCDILAYILKRLKLIEEFVVFGSVCKSWRIVVRDNKRYLPPQIPWLMLQENPENKYHRQIYSLSKEDILTKNLYVPELHDKMCIGLNYGWVFTVTRLGGEMCLVHPISRLQIELPPRASVEGGYKDKEIHPSCYFFSRVVLRGNPSESSDDFMVVAVHALNDYVYYWRPGSKYWVLVGSTNIQTVTCYQDQFYAVSVVGEILILKNDHEGSIVPHVIGKIHSRAFAYYNDTPYIVGSTHGLLVVVRQRYSEGGEGFRGVAPQEEVEREEEAEEEGGECLQGVSPQGEVEWEEEVEDVPEEVLDEEIEWEDWRYGLVKFHVFEFDLINGGYKKTKNLGDRAIFVGHNNSICFDRASELSGIKSNHIYFTDDHFPRYSFLYKGGGKDMGVYALEDGQITQFKIEELSYRSRICPPFWFMPSL